ncbi:MAG: response regulator [Rubripirellula sp.]|jgi:FixJ family two-component response regulator|nr:response regulator [Rubripirellula sp.]
MSCIKSPSPTVYLIDDDPNDVVIIQRLCESVGLKVESFLSPQEFLIQVGPSASGCIVADLMMPEMTGLQLHARLRNSKAAIPIIVMTGHADAQTCRTALRNGVFDFVEKSFNPHDLLVVIQTAIEANAKMNSERNLRDLVMQQLDNLSKREDEVMKLLVTGLTLKAIAIALGISVQTASKHRIRLFEKLGVHNEVELVKLTMRIDPNLPLAAYDAA